MESIYTIKTDAFEGPLEMLLDLVEKRKVHISDVALADVADDYVAHVRALETFPTGGAAHFLLIASTLLLIKSKMLLPGMRLSDEEEADIVDLETRLNLYRLFRKQAGVVAHLFDGEHLFFREEGEMPISFAPHASITPLSLHEAMEHVLGRLPKEEQVPTAIVQKVVSLEEMIGRLTKRITKNLSMSFRDFASGEKAEKVEVVVGFLALLELIKQGAIAVQQERLFGDIAMESAAPAETPHYQ